MTRPASYIVVLGTALLSLGLGTLVYMVARPVAPVFLSFSLPFSSGAVTSLVGAAGYWLPSLTHAFAFTLLSALAAGWSRRALLGSCALWAGLELAFELGQHPVISDLLERANLNLAYFRYGTFDVLDIAASFLGVGLAALITLVIKAFYA